MHGQEVTKYNHMLPKGTVMNQAEVSQLRKKKIANVQKKPPMPKTKLH